VAAGFMYVGAATLVPGPESVNTLAAWSVINSMACSFSALAARGLARYIAPQFPGGALTYRASLDDKPVPGELAMTTILSTSLGIARGHLTHLSRGFLASCAGQAAVLVVITPLLIGPAIGLTPGTVYAQCPESPALKSYDGVGQVMCTCFLPGERAGVVFSPPAGDFPLEILRVGIFWKSQFGGAPQQIEQAIHIYPAGLPNPGAPVFTLPGPMMTDGVLNVFDLEPQPGAIIMNGGSFTVALEFLNQNSGNLFAPSVVDDGNGCLPGQNVVFAGNQWLDACQAGVTGDWVFEVVYRPCTPAVQVAESSWGKLKSLYR
jgi:hypothetical protein